MAIKTLLSGTFTDWRSDGESDSCSDEMVVSPAVSASHCSRDFNVTDICSISGPSPSLIIVDQVLVAGSQMHPGRL